MSLALLACQTPTPVKPVGDIDVISNEVSITPNFATKSLIGQQQTVFRANSQATNSISFSPSAMIIDSAMINDLPVEIATTAQATTLTWPQQRGQPSTKRLNLTYHGTPSRGVTFTDTSVVSNYWGCDWMFCRHDNMADKSTLSVSFRLPDGMTSASNGMPSITPPSLQKWSNNRAYSPYLFGFAAGRFETILKRHRGTELAYVNATGTAQPMERLFGSTPDMIDFFEAKAGLKIPTKRYTQILVAGSDAQEQTTYSLIGTDNITPILTDPKEDWVIAHELAHQWWGNLVTCQTLTDFWLNEGMTVFMTAAWKQHRHGEAAYQNELAVAKTRWQRAIDAGWDKPLAFRGEYPSLRLRRAIQYSKGALFMDHLRTTIGEDAFWSGLRAYTKANAGKSVVSRDFQIAMERASRRDLSAIFDFWVYRGGPVTPATTP